MYQKKTRPDILRRSKLRVIWKCLTHAGNCCLSVGGKGRIWIV